MGTDFYFNWEVQLLKWFQANLQGIAVIFSKLFSIAGSEIVLVGIIIAFYLSYDKKIGKAIMLNTIIGLCFCGVLKSLFVRNRPYFTNKDIECLIPVDSSADKFDVVAQGYSFPSLHSYNSTVISGSVYKCLKTKMWLVIAILLSVFTGLSRMITGNHYPTDVFAGWTIGIISILIVPFLFEKFPKKKIYLALSIIYLFCFIFCRANDFFTFYGIMVGFFLTDIYEEKYVNFSETINIARAIIRIIIAALIFLGITEGLKILVGPFIKNSFITLLFRSFRYGVSCFITMGVYPKIFEKNVFKFDEK